ncbi:MAG TPA: hypothetical protein VGO03_03605 [Acidimicrobiia bacterium]|jgi:hypothetical protein
MTNEPSLPTPERPDGSPAALPSELPNELIDELCSADLDGALAAACVDHGITLADGRAAVDAHASRRAALAAASTQVSQLGPADHLDEVERKRLSRAAVSRATHRRSGRDRRAATVFAIAGAAAVLMLAVVVVALAHTSGDSSSKSAASGHAVISPVAGKGSGTATTPELGVVSNGRDLARRLGLTGQSNSSGLFNGNVADATNGRAGSQPQQHGQSYSVAPGTSSPSSAPVALWAPTDPAVKHCLGSLPLAKGATGVRVVATARVNGEPVTVARGTLGKTVVLWAFHPATCTIAVFYTGT